MNFLSTCAICKRENLTRIGRHLTSHNISMEDYYKTYCKTDDEGNCLECGTGIEFRTKRLSYPSFCSLSCSSKHSNRVNSDKHNLGRLKGRKVKTEKAKEKYEKYVESLENLPQLKENGNICFICNKVIKRRKRHIEAVHNMPIKEYYDAYVRQEGEGICPNCNKETTLYSNRWKYSEFCSRGCSLQYNVINFPEKYAKARESCSIRMSKLNRTDFIYSKANFHYYKNIRMRSSWEKLFAESLDKLGLNWEYEPKTFKVGHAIRYTPDFYVPSIDTYIEIKPSRFVTEKVKNKLNGVRSYGYIIELVTELNWNSFLEGYNE